MCLKWFHSGLYNYPKIILLPYFAYICMWPLCKKMEHIIVSQIMKHYDKHTHEIFSQVVGSVIETQPALMRITTICYNSYSYIFTIYKQSRWDSRVHPRLPCKKPVRQNDPQAKVFTFLQRLYGAMTVAKVYLFTVSV